MKPGFARTALGLGADIFADPLTYITGGLSKAGKLSKLSKLAKPGSRVAKGVEKLKAAGKYAPFGETIEEQLRLGQRGMKFAGKPIAPKTQAKIYGSVVSPLKENIMSSRMAGIFSTKAGPPEVRTAREIITAEKHAFPEIIDRIRKGGFDREKIAQGIAKKHKLPVEDVRGVLTHLSEYKAPADVPAFLGVAGGIEETMDPTKLGKMLKDPDAVQFSKEMKEMMVEIGSKEKKAGVLKSTLETEQLDYITHLITPEARAALKKENKRSVLKKIIDMTHPSTKHRMLFVPTDPKDVEIFKQLRNMNWTDKMKLVEEGRIKFPSIAEINQLAREGNLVKGKKINQFLYEDPAKIAAIRQLRSEKALMSARILENSRDVGLKEGWAIELKKGDAIEPGWDFVKSPLTQDVVFKKDAADLLNASYQVLNDSKQMNYLVGAYKKSLQWWKIWTLMPFPSYHFRNVFGGNLFNQMLAGMNPIKEGWWNPKGSNALAGKVQRVNVWKNRGLPASGARKKLSPLRPVKGEEFKYAKTPGWAKETITTDTGIKYTLDQVDEFAKQAGIYRAGQFTADIYQDVPTFVKETKRTANPFKTHNIFTETGMKVGSALEDNAKLGTFVYFLKKGYDPGEAGKLAHKFIFDYFDIPKSVEKAKNFTPFITWYYKNIPLQLEYMAKKPRVFSSIYKTKIEITGKKEPRPDVMTEYYHDSYPVVFGKKGKKAKWAGLGHWLPVTDVNILADPKEWGSMVWPGIKTPTEMLFNRELYFNKPIFSTEKEPVSRKQMFGVYGPNWMSYLAKQHRAPATLDRLNPANIFGTEKKKGLLGLGQKRGGKWELPQSYRWLRELTGLRTYETNIQEAVDRKVNVLSRKKARLRGRLKYQVDKKEIGRMRSEIREIENEIRSLKRYRY